MPHIEDHRTDEEIAALEKWATAQYGNVRVRFTEGIEGRTRRRYLVSIDGSKEVNRPSVTTIGDKHFAKALEFWYEKKAFEASGLIIEDVLSHVDGTEDSKDEALRIFANLAKEGKMFSAAYAMGLTPSQVRDEAGLDGHVLHTAVEDWFKHGQVPDLSLVEPEKRGKMQALAGFLADVRPRMIASEPPVYSSRYGYTGRPDLLAEVDHHIPATIQTTNEKSSTHEGWLPPGTILFDFKSGNKLWTNHGVQLGMYEQALEECGFPMPEWRVGVHLRDDGYVLHAFPDYRSIIAPLMDLYKGFMAINKIKAALNKSFLEAPEVEAVA